MSFLPLKEILTTDGARFLSLAVCKILVPCVMNSSLYTPFIDISDNRASFSIQFPSIVWSFKDSRILHSESQLKWERPDIVHREETGGDRVISVQNHTLTSFSC